MDRRFFLGGAGATALLAATPARLTAQTRSGDAAFRALLDKIFYDRLDERPEGATRLGLDTGPRAALRSRLSDESAAATERSLARSKAELAMIREVEVRPILDMSGWEL